MGKLDTQDLRKLEWYPVIIKTSYKAVTNQWHIVLGNERYKHVGCNLESIISNYNTKASSASETNRM